MQLRPYQDRSIVALYEYLRAKQTNPCLVLPTGSGKTPVMAHICKDAVGRWSGRVLILAHRRELLEQSAEKLALIAPELRIGIYSAGLKRRETGRNVIIAGIQSVYERAEELGHFDLIMVDECHLIPPAGDGMYRTFLTKAKEVNQFVRVIGLTATPYRMTTGLICTEENILQEICYEVGVRELIVDGYLCKLVSRSAKPEGIANTNDVSERGGEFIADELELAMSDAAIVKAAVSELIEHAEKTARMKVLVFACGIKHANLICDELRANGVTENALDFVHGETPSEERRLMLARFKDQASGLRYLVNVNVLTEGFDAPNIDCIALMRATKSPGLYCQLVGRGLRTCPEKEDCLVLDFGENVLRHGPIDRVRPKARPAGGDGEAPCKICPECRGYVLLAAKICPYCNFEFPKQLIARHKEKSGEEAIVGKEIETLWHHVTNVYYSVHTKKGASPEHPRTFRVDYRVGWQRHFSEWICVEHPLNTFARAKAMVWWESRCLQPGIECPSNAEDCVSAGHSKLLREPVEIQVRQEVTAGPAHQKAFPRIVAVKYSQGGMPEREPGEEEREQMAEPAATQKSKDDWIAEIDPEDIPF